MPWEAKKDKIPKTWPKDAGAKYTSRLEYSASITPAILAALNRPPDDGSAVIIPPPPTPCPLVAIKRITDPTHPACGQHGLFAATTLPHDSLIVLYAGRVQAQPTTAADTNSDLKADLHSHSDSDYDLSMDSDLGVSVDARWAGSEARFANDFRRVRERANATFRDVWVRVAGGPAGFEGKLERRIGVFAACGRGAVIRKGEEIVVSYGKGFWRARAEQSLENVVGEEEDPQRDAS